MTRPSAVDIVLGQMKSWIADGTYKSGDRLPSEGELCAKCQVSRGTVREAMKVLSAVGIVDVKQGDGTYISKDVSSNLVLNPLLLAFQKSSWTPRQLAEFRGAIEHSVAELIVHNATDREIQSLRSYNDALHRAVEEGKTADVQLQLDLAFHKQMGMLTHNVLLEILYNRVLDFFFEDTERGYRESHQMGELSVRLHDDICSSLENRDLDGACKEIDLAMENHVTPIDENYSKMQGGRS